MKSDDTEMNPETTELAYQESLTTQDALSRRVAAIDTKLLAVFGISSFIVTLVPTLALPQLRAFGDESVIAQLLWAGAALGWALSAAFVYLGIKPRDWKIGPDPKVLRDEKWLTLTPHEYRHSRMWYLGRMYSVRLQGAREKAKYLEAALSLVVAEVACFAAALPL